MDRALSLILQIMDCKGREGEDDRKEFSLERFSLTGQRQGHLLAEEVGLRLKGGSRGLQTPFLNCFRKLTGVHQKEF